MPTSVYYQASPFAEGLQLQQGNASSGSYLSKGSTFVAGQPEWRGYVPPNTSHPFNGPGVAPIEGSEHLVSPVLYRSREESAGTVRCAEAQGWGLSVGVQVNGAPQGSKMCRQRSSPLRTGMGRPVCVYRGGAPQGSRLGPPEILPEEMPLGSPVRPTP